MNQPKKPLPPTRTEQELVKILEELDIQKTKAIANREFEKAAYLRDEERKYIEELEEVLNPPTQEENGHSED